MPRKTKRKKTTKVLKVEKRNAKEIKQDLILSGSSELLPKATNQPVIDSNELIKNCARVLNISTLGVTIMEDGMPYINKLGRKEKLEQYLALDGLKYRIDYEWIQMSKNDIDKAVCQAFFVEIETGNIVSSKIIGECSPATVKSFAGYQNHQAQTRAHNRLIEEVYGVRIHEEMVENIAKLKEKGKIKIIPVINTTVSAEEIEIPKNDAQKSENKCELCGTSITVAEANFSKKIHKKCICRKCQIKK